MIQLAFPALIITPNFFTVPKRCHHSQTIGSSLENMIPIFPRGGVVVLFIQWVKNVCHHLVGLVTIVTGHGQVER